MVWSIASSRGRQRLAEDASQSRRDEGARRWALALVIAYNIVGLLDITSTHLSLAAGAGEEANPVMRLAMNNLGPGWIGAKLFLQGVISAMVLWFPHRIVLTIFLAAVSSNAVIVGNNFRIFLGG